MDGDGAEQDAVQVVFAGHLDHGKSTLIGRLRAALGLPHERLAAAELREWGPWGQTCPSERSCFLGEAGSDWARGGA
jgi:translation elongation factor EF-Tu-like GTPase